MNLWYYLCFILLVYNLLLLIDERKLVVYNDKENSEELNRNPQYSLCLNIKELIENKKLKENEIYSPKQMIDTLVNSTLIGNKDYLNLNSSLIRQHHACIDFKAEKFHLIFPNISNYKFKIFFNPSQETLIYFFEHVYTHNQLKDGFILDIRFLRIRFLPSPFETNCTRQIDGPAKNNFNKKQYKIVECLLNCHKLNRNSTFFYYDYAEEVQLKLDQKEFILNEKCFELCNYQDCFAKWFFVYVHYDEKNDYLPEIKTTNDYIDAIPALSSVDFIIQFVSVIVLFLNISLYEILLILIKILKSKFNNRRLLLKVLINSDYFASAICILLLASISAYYIYDYFEFNFLVKGFLKISKELIPFSVFICLPVQLAYLKNYGQLSFRNEQIFENDSFLEIENCTNVKFKDLIKNSYLKKGGFEIPYQIDVENNTIFRSEDFLGNSKEKLLSRCFRIDLNINEYRYERSLAFTQLILELNYSNFKIYYTDFGKNLTSYHSQINRKSIISLFKYIYLEHPYSSNCKYYNGYCVSKNDCIDFCYNKYYFGNYSSISTESIIYKKDLDSFYLSKAYFNRSEDKKIRYDCTLLHQKKDCEIVSFFNYFQRIEFNGNKSSNNLLVVDLYFFEDYTFEIKATTLTMLFLNLLNFESVIVGLNANKALNILLNFIKKTLRSRNQKFCGLFLISFSFTGFLIHSFFFLNEILTSKLVTSESFERLTTIESADFIICFDEIRLVPINEYEKYTGTYLDELTSNYNFESYFDNITILDDNFRPLTVNVEKITSIENRIQVNRSFLFDMNCFQFRTNITYSINDQLRFEEMFFAKIHFKERVYLNECSCLKFYIGFYEKRKGSFEKLDGNYLRRNNSSNIKSAFSIQPLEIEYDYTDRFYYLSHPLSIFKVDS